MLARLGQDNRLITSAGGPSCHMADDLAFHAQHRGGRVLLSSTYVPDGNELACLHSAFELLPDLGNRGLAHPTIQCCFQNVAPVFDRRAVKNMIAGVGHGLPRRLRGFVSGRSDVRAARPGRDAAAIPVPGESSSLRGAVELPSQPPPRLTAQEESNEIEVQTIP